ncbi:UNVERIFIED_CONTAM: hypothetical protein GTU68_023199 [Idotea baltica]|nr:hypothetical protein [Idotea baltica]
MATSLKNLSEYDSSTVPNAEEYKFGIVVADWNDDITHTLLEGCANALEEHGTKPENIKIIHVPGSYELPYGAQLLLDDKKFDAVIAIGAVITGETKHDEYICNAVSQGVMQLGLTYKTPVIFGLLTPRNMEQAKDRAGGKHGNKGVEAAITAIKLVALAEEMNKKPARKIGW